MRHGTWTVDQVSVDPVQSVNRHRFLFLTSMTRVHRSKVGTHRCGEWAAIRSESDLIPGSSLDRRVLKSVLRVSSSGLNQSSVCQPAESRSSDLASPSDGLMPQRQSEKRMKSQWPTCLKVV